MGWKHIEVKYSYELNIKINILECTGRIIFSYDPTKIFPLKMN